MVDKLRRVISQKNANEVSDSEFGVSAHAGKRYAGLVVHQARKGRIYYT